MVMPLAVRHAVLLVGEYVPALVTAWQLGIPFTRAGIVVPSVAGVDLAGVPTAGLALFDSKGVADSLVPLGLVLGVSADPGFELFA